MALLVVRRRRVRLHADVAQVELAEQALDRAALARRVPALEHDAQRRPEPPVAGQPGAVAAAAASRRSWAAASRSSYSAALELEGEIHLVEASHRARNLCKAGERRRIVRGTCRTLHMSTNRASSRLGLSTSEAARHLGVSLSTVRRWSDSGHLRGYRTPGGQRRFTIEQLDAFLDVAPASRPPSRDAALDPAAARTCPICTQVCGVAQTSPNADTSRHERDPDERRRRDARGQPEHAAQLGAPLRLPVAAAQPGRPPAVRARRDRGAAPGARGDAQRLVRHLDRA